MHRLAFQDQLALLEGQRKIQCEHVALSSVARECGSSFLPHHKTCCSPVVLFYTWRLLCLLLGDQ